MRPQTMLVVVRLLAAIIAAAFLRSSCAEPSDSSLPIFAGILDGASTGTRFSLRWQTANGAVFQSWFTLGEKAAGFELIAFDRKAQTLSLRDSAGRTYKLVLPDGHVAEELSDAEFHALSQLRTAGEPVPVLSRTKARAYWLRLIQEVSRPAPPGAVLDIFGATLPPQDRKWFLDGKQKGRTIGRLGVVVVIDGKSQIRDYPINAFGPPEPLTRNLLPSDWDELSLLSVSECL